MLIALAKQIPDWETQIRQGSFKVIGEWLKNNVHKLGSLYNPGDLVKKITGESPDSKYFLQYLNTKFSKIYQF
jgi:carboxypeptidase Taq